MLKFYDCLVNYVSRYVLILFYVFFTYFCEVSLLVEFNQFRNERNIYSLLHFTYSIASYKNVSNKFLRWFFIFFEGWKILSRTKYTYILVTLCFWTWIETNVSSATDVSKKTVPFHIDQLHPEDLKLCGKCEKFALHHPFECS